MTDPRKQKIIDFGAETLAEVLLNLAVNSEEVNSVIEQLISTEDQKIQYFKKQISNLKRSERFIDFYEISSFARELEMLLLSLKFGISDPLVALELVASFYEADDTIFDMCEDYDGRIKEIFCYDAKNLFIYYASRYDDKEKIAEIILKLNKESDYSVRKILIDSSSKFLSEDVIRNMIAKLQKCADIEKDKYGRNHYLMLIESLACQIKDARLFEKTRTASSVKLSKESIVEIARAYMESGDVETAHSWLKKIKEKDTFLEYERDELLLQIYKIKGDSEKLKDLLYKKFKSDYSTENLQELLDVIGHEMRDEVINDATMHILNAGELELQNLYFLIDTGKLGEAEDYLISRADQLDGDDYYSLPSAAEVLEAKNLNLSSSLILRSLLTSVLDRGYSKAYHHGISYLKKLDKLSKNIADWKGFDNHETYKEHIIQVHKKKWSFWAKYKEK